MNINLLEHTELFKPSRHFANINAINFSSFIAKDGILSLANRDFSEKAIL